MGVPPWVLRSSAHFTYPCSPTGVYNLAQVLPEVFSFVSTCFCLCCFLLFFLLKKSCNQCISTTYFHFNILNFEVYTIKNLESYPFLSVHCFLTNYLVPDILVILKHQKIYYYWETHTYSKKMTAVSLGFSCSQYL